MQNHLNLNKKAYIINFMIVLVVWGWLILSNLMELLGTKINLYMYIIMIAPIYIFLFIMGNYEQIYNRAIIFILITIQTLIYFIFLGVINNNITVHTKYYFNMIHTSFIILPALLVNVKKFSIKYYSDILYKVSGLFSWLAFINICKSGFVVDSRFLNANITGFLVAQYIILSVYYRKKSIWNKITISTSIIVLLACGTRSAMMGLVITILLKDFKYCNTLEKIKKIGKIVLVYLCGFYLYYKLILISELRFYLRPLGVIFLDKSNIFNQASMGRIDYFEEYISIIFDKVSNFIFGVGPNSFTNYSHNMFIDLIGFGGIVTLIIYLMIYIYIYIKCEKNILFYQFIFFSIAFLFTSSIFVNSVYFSIMLIMICLGKNTQSKEVRRRIYEF